LVEGKKEYRMYAINYLIDLIFHRQKMWEIDFLFHLLNELAHGKDIKYSILKAIKQKHPVFRK